jgi:hypothetical protein
MTSTQPTERQLVRTQPTRGMGAVHYGKISSRGRPYIVLACSGRTIRGFVVDASTPSGERAIERGVTCRSCSGQRRTPVRDAAPLAHPSLLSARDRATLSPEAQIAKLVRIARRASAHAEWIEELMAKAPELYATGPERVDALADIAASSAKAAAAAGEIERIARTNNISPRGGW